MDDAEVRDRARAFRLLRSGEARRLRQAAGHTLAEAAVECGGVAETTVCRWEAGLRQPRGETATAVGRYLGRLQRLVGAGR